MRGHLDRRRFLTLTSQGIAGLALTGCGGEADRPADAGEIEAHRAREAAASGKGPFGVQRFRGYRGLAELPWYGLDSEGRLELTDDSIPAAIDFHGHLGMSVLFEPALDFQHRAPRVKHLLDCDAESPGCELDLDVYINANFTEKNLDELTCHSLSIGLWGSENAETQTIPNLLAEMDSVRVEQAVILPIVMGLPFGDRLASRWSAEIQRAGVGHRLISGGSVHPHHEDRIVELEASAAAGQRIIKMHPTVQGFYPDEAGAMEVYERAQELGLIIFFHGGRAGIEPESRQKFALPKHYKKAFSSFPRLPFVIGHGGARDLEAMMDAGKNHPNVYFGVHGQGVTELDRMIDRIGEERLLFGTDWPFYHLAATQAKILLVTDSVQRKSTRHALLRGNAERLLSSVT